MQVCVCVRELYCHARAAASAFGLEHIQPWVLDQAGRKTTCDPVNSPLH